MTRTLALCLLIGLSLPTLAESIKNPYLYRITTAQGTSYILGSQHVYVHMHDFPFDLRALIAGSDVVMPEVDVPQDEIELWQKDGKEYLRQMAVKSPVPKNPVDAWTVKKLVEYGLSIEVAAKVRDNNCGAVILPFEYRNDLPLDAEIIQTAHLSQRPITALDTEALRIEASKLEPKCDFHQMFTDSTPQELFIQNDQALKDMASAYAEGIEPTDDDDAATVFRNVAWIPKIESQLNSGKAFIVAGFSHLFGRHGVLQLLHNDGYTVTRVTGTGN